MKHTEIYPCTIIMDRYSGAYSGGSWLAFNLGILAIPDGINESDVPCAIFWDEYDKEHMVGKGNSPELAYQNLETKLENNENISQT